MKKKFKKINKKSKTISKKESDLMSGESFTDISRPKKQQHVSVPGQLPKDDENTFAFEETLIGMEYDLEPKHSRKWKENSVNDRGEAIELDLNELI